MKKVLTLLIAVMASVNVVLAENVNHVLIGELYYNLDRENLEATVTYEQYDEKEPENYTSLSSVIIPSTVKYEDQTYNVTRIGIYAFNGCKGLISVEIPSSVTRIDDGAFNNCLSLFNIVVPNTVQFIAEWAFKNVLNISYEGTTWGWGARSVNGYIEGDIVYKDATKTELLGCKATVVGDVTIPNTVTVLGNYAFYGCEGIKSITFSENMTEINQYAFYNCTALESIVIPDNITRIGYETFYHCSNLKSVTIGTGVTFISSYAFENCENLKTVHNYSASLFVQKGSYNNGYVAYYATEVHNYNFVANGTCGDALNWEFRNNKLTISGSGPMTAYSYSNQPWYDYRNTMDTLVIEEGCTAIGSYAFWNMSLKCATLPSSLTTFGDYAFSSCAQLSVIHNYSAIYLSEGTLSNGYVAYYAKEIHNYHEFSGRCGDDVYWKLADGLLTISGEGSMGKYSYSDMPWYSYRDGIKTVVVSEGVTTIGEYAFYWCSNLTSADISSSVVEIGKSAFSNCGFFSLEVPSTVTQIGNYAFDDIPNVVYNGSASGSPWKAKCVNGYIEGWLLYPDNTKTTLVACNKEAHGAIVLPQSLKTIESKAFYYCKKIESVILPESVTSLGSMTFYHCHALKSIVIPDKVTEIPMQAFESCAALDSVYIGAGVQTFGDYSFEGCNNLTKVVWNAKHCQDFTNTNTPFYYYQKKTSYSSARVVYDVRDKITSFTFGDEVEYIPAYLCWGMTNVPEIVVPDCKMEMGTSALEGSNYSINGAYNIVYPDTTLCFGTDLIIDGVWCDLDQWNLSQQTWTRTYSTVEGCDSTISIKVTWERLPSSIMLSSKDAYDSPNTGSITIDRAIEGKYDYYTLNGVKNASLNNLPAGNYTMWFVNELCEDSTVKQLQIEQYGMRINNQYYILVKESHIAYLTYRGTSFNQYSNVYSGNVTIPKKVTFQGEEYTVAGINYGTFVSSPNVTSLTLLSEEPIEFPEMDHGLNTQIPVFVPYGTLSSYQKQERWKDLNLHVMNPRHTETSNNTPTSVTITFGDEDDAAHIVSCGMEGREVISGNVMDLTGLEPNKKNNDIVLFINTNEGDHDTIHCSITTPALTLTTQESKTVSTSVAILLAQTNIADIETGCGFEWKPNNAPDDYTGPLVQCPVANGLMAGRLKGVQSDVFYKYRAYYKSSAGNMYYGDWKYIYTGTGSVEFTPIVYTYAATGVKENEATLKGCAIAGAEDFDDQGFQYWAESRVSNAQNAPSRVKAALGERHTIPAGGISMTVTLTDLDAGTVYKYRTYAKTGDQINYGSEMSFTTQGEYIDNTSTAIDQITDDHSPVTNKIIKDNQLLILRDGKTYTVTGQRL